MYLLISIVFEFKMIFVGEKFNMLLLQLFEYLYPDSSTSTLDRVSLSLKNKLCSYEGGLKECKRIGFDKLFYSQE